eukprot:CAMPEP_0197181170 /NCGR_PEP_ID=MMETSP1423-20130617/5530_1 /TAXON_ID=476441 /ORGANISM="Pseudo-nitzschia heimii, Strain UNC1101" /LENGTH=77 /DNA_ID=CAMNT_0042631365 /DNA_START=239 /DNA_END=469 /DNA_ORIENTATION=-
MSFIASRAAWKFLAVNLLDNDNKPSTDSLIVHVEDGCPKAASAAFASSIDNFAESSSPEQGSHFGALEGSDIALSVN